MGEGNSEQIEQEVNSETPTEASKSFLQKAKRVADRLLNLYSTKQGTAFMTAFNTLAGSMITRDLIQGDIKRAVIGLGPVALANYLTLRKPLEEPPRDERGRFVKRTP